VGAVPEPDPPEVARADRGSALPRVAAVAAVVAAVAAAERGEVERAVVRQAERRFRHRHRLQ